ncbi:nucleic acid-binding protein [Gonapodya prolifera JEL478]|uniref:Nucleic acid-binding protein n=1 Tax=Gonapodya prolifera (strain JEL478) TaxID=1344416 RepID=A0A139A886_GONPJ|nr:nucleic acid-binding protein [Gonapodya prolifera JEL478]|eukprot:KXS12655.1 nucleic acid-binding protein [Gonapodya prolifera JEL478]
MNPHFVGEVVSAGKMMKTVKVRIARQRLHPVVLKWVTYHKTFFVHDPESQLVVGDIVRIAPCNRISKHKHFRLEEIVRPAQRYLDSETGIMYSGMKADRKRDIREIGKAGGIGREEEQEGLKVRIGNER